MDATTLGSRISTYLKTRGMTQEDLSKSISKGRPLVNMYLKGKVKMSYDVLISIADAIDVSLDELCDRTQYIRNPDNIHVAQDPPAAYGKVTYHNRFTNKSIPVDDENVLTQIRLGHIEDTVQQIADQLKELKTLSQKHHIFALLLTFLTFYL